MIVSLLNCLIVGRHGNSRNLGMSIDVEIAGIFGFGISIPHCKAQSNGSLSSPCGEKPTIVGKLDVTEFLSVRVLAEGEVSRTLT